MPDSFVSNYSWLVAPGDCISADYTSPTVVKAWAQTTGVAVNEADKQRAYGQWIAQLLDNQLGTKITSRYKVTGYNAWPLTLRDDVIKALDTYFNEEAK